MSGGMGMLPPQMSSDDEDEDTGLDEAEPEGEEKGALEDEGDVDSEAFGDRRGMARVVRLDDDEVMDSDGIGDGNEREEDMDDEGDVQMVQT